MTEERDYRSTVFLPKTDFPMKAGLPQKEPAILARWQQEGLYEKTRAARAGREKFILHDGPPYANGDMHIGHALNHILKDMVVRTQTLLGKDAPYVPGWDCHGLPIEWKVEEQYRKKKLDKDQVDPVEFRAECRAYAAEWVNVQREQLKRLGINGDWDKPYLTMDSQAEGTIVSELLKFAESGQLYRGAKPVMWSPVEKTALAEAEVEYEDIVSTQIDVAFEITHSPIAELVGAHAVIWTTTPWTIPVNQALAYGPEVEYVLIDIVDCTPAVPLRSVYAAGGQTPNIPAHVRDVLLDKAPSASRFLVASMLVDEFIKRYDDARIAEAIDGVRLRMEFGKPIPITADLAGTLARHPMHHLGGFFAEPRPMLPGDFVTTDSGTGLVHMAPDHGEDDFDLCKAHGIGPKFVVEADGKYRADWPWLGGQGSVINPKFNAPDGPICSDLREAGGLLAASADYKHSYPHSWRSKAKVIYRCTPQWFVPMDQPRAPSTTGPAGGPPPRSGEEPEGAANPVPPRNGEGDQPQAGGGGPTLRQTAIQAIADTRFVPDKGRNRIGAMVEGRPDWVLSRQRAWGVPITLFVNRESGQYLVDPKVNARIIAAVMQGGVDAWSDARAQEYLGDQYRAEDYERVVDILDVWFDSGSTHAFVLESGRWPELSWPADLYLEGSDQHRGWFQSSLLESCATRGRAPYNAVLTHGFTMDAKGLKMSKSLGNTVSPLKVMETNGADIIRLWALSVDYTEDHRIGDEILKGVADQYRKLRNTFRYMLGALADYDPAEAVPVAEMPELERYVLALLGRLDATLKQAVADFDFNTYVRALIDFCNEDLSAFFFDIRKDSLYCDAATDPKRRAYRTVLDTLFQALIRYAAPVLVFTAEEIWQSRYPGAETVHLLEWPSFNAPADEDLIGRWNLARSVRQQALNVLEPMRREKLIGSSLQASVKVELYKEDNLAPLKTINLAELFLVEDVGLHIATELMRVVAAEPSASSQYHYGGALISGFVSSDLKCGRCWRHLPEVEEDGSLCARCTDVVGTMEPAA